MIRQIVDKADFDEAVALLKKLVSVNTVNPPGNEIKLLPIVKEVFASLGAKLEIWEKKKGRANFIGKLGSGSPSVGFFPHLDTVPAGDGWKTDPFTPVIKNGRLYARGAVDSKGNFVSSWLAIKTFLNLHKKWRGTIYLVGCADEETGSEFGVKYLLEKGFKVDYAIVPDGGAIDKIIIGEKGRIHLTLKSYGKQAHASEPNQGINALEHLVKLLSKIMALKFEDLSFHKSFDGVTQNIGVLRSGHAANIIPAFAQAEIDIRFPLGIDKKDIMKKIRTIIEEFIKKEKPIRQVFDSEVAQTRGAQGKHAKIDIEETFSTPPHLTDQDSPIIKAFRKSAKESGLKMRIGTMGGITDAKSLSLAGIDTLVHFLDDGSHSAHNANEYVLLENIKIAASLYAQTLAKIFKA